MFLNFKLIGFLLAVFTVALSATAQAQELSFSLGRFGRHGSFQLAVGAPFHAYAPRRAPRRVWVAGHYEVRHDQVWVNGGSRQEYVPPRYEWRFDACGRAVRMVVSAGGWTTVVDPGHYQTREVRVWVQGHWQSV